MRSKGYEALILITYILMAAVCIYLNFYTRGQAGNIANLIVNLCLFIIAGVIFAICTGGSLVPTALISGDLKRVTLKIEEDAKHTHKYLWEKYRDEKEELFKEKKLVRQYQDYLYELERIVHTDKTYYKCDIEDYIGYDLIDSVIHRDNLNQVAGVMTGLGILGTFIGLSLGLQNFNTGTTLEITESIEPLMNGIKVAFHTSIFGMVFSLVFNYVYKRRLNDAEEAVRAFLAVYRKYVMPDTATDGINRLMELQQQQAEAVLSLSDTVVRELPRGFQDVLKPEFDRFNETIENFANVATKNQAEQLKRIVDSFIAEMNRSLDDSFVKLSDTINSTLDVQEKNSRQMEELYSKNLSTAESVNVIATDTRILANSIKDYAAAIKEMEESIYKETEVLSKESEVLSRKIPEMVDLSTRNLQDSMNKVSMASDELKDAARYLEDAIRQETGGVRRR